MISFHDSPREVGLVGADANRLTMSPSGMHAPLRTALPSAQLVKITETIYPRSVIL